MDLIDSNIPIYEGERVVEVNEETLETDLKDSVVFTKFVSTNRRGIRSLTLRSDPPAEFFKKIVINKADNQFGFAIQGGYFCNNTFRPTFISKIGDNCEIINGTQLKLGMWVVEVNGNFVFYNRRSTVAEHIQNSNDKLTLIVFDVEKRSKKLKLPGVLSTIPCTFEVIKKYDF